MSYYDYEYDYTDEMDNLELKFKDFKDEIIGNMVEEAKKEIESKYKSQFEKIKNFDKYKSEELEKLSTYKREFEAYKKEETVKLRQMALLNVEIQNKSLIDIFKQLERKEYYYIETSYNTKIPKCDKCDANRYLKLKDNSGCTHKIKCSCDGTYYGKKVLPTKLYKHNNVYYTLDINSREVNIKHYYCTQIYETQELAEASIKQYNETAIADYYKTLERKNK